MTREPRVLGPAIGVVPWLVGATFLLYLMGYVDGGVHGSILAGESGTFLNYVHEFFHHARHAILMCH